MAQESFFRPECEGKKNAVVVNVLIVHRPLCQNLDKTIAKLTMEIEIRICRSKVPLESFFGPKLREKKKRRGGQLIVLYNCVTILVEILI